MNIVDLHVHSNKSDGSLTPTQLVEYAVQKGLSAFALTDHDSTEGIEEALAAAEGKNIEVIPGIEFSTDYEGKEVHIVGLYIDYKSDFIKRRLVNFVNSRNTRNKEMCKRLTENGIPITYEQLTAEFPNCVITRGHYAKYMVNHGYTKSMQEGFERFVGDHCPCFIPRKKITPMRAIEIILKAGGFPILAHPVLYHMSNTRLDEMVRVLKEAGLQGIEAIYSSYSPSEEREMRRLAAKYELCISGGSDFHGATKPGLDLAVGYGKLVIPEDILLEIKLRRQWLLSHLELYHKTKICFTDLDGTLLNDNKQISSYTKEVLEKWTAAGHKFALCSGRDINSIGDVKSYLGLDFPGMYLIGCNGGQIYDCDAQKTIYKITLSLTQIQHIMQEAERFGLHCHTYSDTHIISPKADDELTYYKRVISTPVSFSSDVTTALPSEGACKCIAITLNDFERLEQFRVALFPWAEKEGISLLYSQPRYLEIFPAASGKGAAVLKLCEFLSIDTSYAIAVGDAENDISMVQVAGTGIAMANAMESVKAVATTITSADNNHDGLALALIDLR